MIDSKILQKIKREYIAGKGSQRSLAEKYGVSRATIEKVAQREKWCDARLRAYGKSSERIADAVAEEVVSQAAKIDTTFYDMVDLLMALTVKSMSQSDKAGHMSSASLKHYANTITAIQKMKGIKSDLDTEEQRAKIDKIRNEIAAADKTTNEIVIDLGGAAQWAK